LSAQLPLDFSAAIRARDAALGRCEQSGGEKFRSDAARFILAYLGAHGETPGEVLTEKGWEFGLRPTSLKHWGPVFMRLLREQRIEQCGTARRMRGHGSTGGKVYRLRQG